MCKPVVYILLMSAMIFTAGTLHAGDKAILDIKPPSSETGKPVKGADLKEGKFDGYGTIDSITAGEVVIDDAYYRLASSVSFKYLNGNSTSAVNFPVGTKVWFMLYTDNIIKSVWKEGG